jgi:2-polyprenyl-6-methoxyphenol hydroxylase-like FAD-dependent oxidoreductase
MTNSIETANNHVCIAGAGPAGVMLSILFARKGIPVTLLEAQADFDRDFRGDTLHASALEILEQMGLAQEVLALCHAKAPRFQLITTQDTITMADFSRLDSPYPYIALIPQARFLEFLTEEAKKFPNFTLIMNAKVHGLIIENDRVCGISYTKDVNGRGRWTWFQNKRACRDQTWQDHTTDGCHLVQTPASGIFRRSECYQRPLRYRNNSGHTGSGK